MEAFAMHYDLDWWESYPPEGRFWIKEEKKCDVGLMQAKPKERMGSCWPEL